MDHVPKGSAKKKTNCRAKKEGRRTIPMRGIKTEFGFFLVVAMKRNHVESNSRVPPESYGFAALQCPAG